MGGHRRFMERQLRFNVRKLLWMFGLCLVLGLVFLYYTGTYRESYTKPLSTGFVLDTPGCQIPEFDPFNPHVLRKYMSQKRSLDCAGKHPVLVESYLTALYLVRSALKAYGVTNVDSLECCYRPFWRIDGDLANYSLGVDDKVRFSPNCTVFRRETAVRDEFVAVTCSVGHRVVYRDFHAFFPLKAELEERYSRAKQRPEALSVIMVGLDSVSRPNLHRLMPRTVAQLAYMDAIEMFGYNKGMKNTFPFMVAVLGGRTLEELKAQCWLNLNTSFDRCHWIWSNFSDAGYRTAFGEDSHHTSAFNHLQRMGFVKQPTDYYMRPYSIISEKTIMHTGGLCIGPRTSLEMSLQYASKFARTEHALLKFGLFHSARLTHDVVTYPRLGDELNRDFLRELYVSYSLNNTGLVYYSDHGMRYGDFVETYQGRLEISLPFLFFIFPPWFRERYTLAVFNLETNARRLITAFDLHSTLLDFADLGRIDNDAIRRRTRDELQPLPRGISLFLPVPENRTCSDAGIEQDFCSCQKTELQNPYTPEVNTMAHSLLDHLNTMLQPFQECAQLKLAEIKDARLYLREENPGNIKDYKLLVRTTPGDAMFAATIRHFLQDDTKQVMGTVSRVNKYGDQSACVKDFHVKPYCFCN